MPRPRTLENRSEAIIALIAPDAPDRFVDLQVEVRQGRKCPEPGKVVGFPVGGRWDRLERRYVPGRAATSVVIEIIPGQLELMEAFFCWLRAYVTGDWADWEAKHGRRPYSFWAVGGRRRGKSWIGVVSVLLFAVALAGSFPWIVSAVEEDFLENEELPRYWRRIVPAAWYDWDDRELAITLVNGSRIELRSAHDPQKLKTGEASFVFFNEVQKHSQIAYDNLRGAIADSGSMVFVAANPPRLAVGYWSQDLVIKLRRGDVDGYLKEFHDANPFVDEGALDSMSKEMSARDYAIEREGRFMARTDIVMHAFEAGGQHGNVQLVPQIGDISPQFLRRKLGKAFECVISCDFQLTPHMAAIVERFFVDDASSGEFGRGVDALSWTVDEVIVEAGDENDLIDGLESLGYLPSQCAVIADASGDWQQADRKRGKLTGRGSFDMFRARGWRNLYKPSPWSEKNPLILERVAVGNARLRRHDGRQLAFVAPHCQRTIEALSKWPNGREGFPSRHSQYAHIGDAWTYSKYRLWPRRLRGKGGDGEGPTIRPINIHGRDDAAFT